MKGFHAITHVWGRAYLDLFLNICIPNQLAQGNVPALPSGSRYRILTRSDHVDELTTHPMVEALRQLIPVDIVAVAALKPDSGTRSSLDQTIACHRLAIAEAGGAVLLFLSADVVFSSTAFAAVVRRQQEGYRAVVTTGLRLAKEPFLRALDRALLPSLSSRDLVRLALPHLHQHERDMWRKAKPSIARPVAVHWPVGEVGLLTRSFHLHPLMVDPISPTIELDGTIDDRYLSAACPDPSRIYAVTDSDELQVFELTTEKQEILRRRAAGMSVHAVTNQALRCAALHLQNWERTMIRVHADDLDNQWRKVEAESQVFAASVMRALRMAQMRRAMRRYVKRAPIERRWRRFHKRVARTLRILRSRLKRYG